MVSRLGCVLHLDADMLHDSKLACLLHSRQVKEKQAIEKGIVKHRHQYQQPQGRREYDLNDPDRCRKIQPGDAQMTLPGLVGEDPDSKSRRQRQREQLRGWLMQQQSERVAERHQQELEGRSCRIARFTYTHRAQGDVILSTSSFSEQRYDQSRVEINNKTLQLQRIEMERRKAAAVAIKEYNLAKVILLYSQTNKL